MNKKRLAAGVVAAVLLAGFASLAMTQNIDAVRNDAATEKEPVSLEERNRSFAYGLAQSLYLKINELWRLSLNSDLNMETTVAISTLNNGFNTELLEKAIDEKGEDVIDEYIYSVLAGLGFELYLNDAEAYYEEKSEVIYTGEVLTRAKIDEYLNELNKQTVEVHTNDAVNSLSAVDVPAPGATNISSVLPEPPSAKSIKPETPADVVRRETDAMANNAFGIEVE